MADFLKCQRLVSLLSMRVSVDRISKNLRVTPTAFQMGSFAALASGLAVHFYSGDWIWIAIGRAIVSAAIVAFGTSICRVRVPGRPITVRIVLGLFALLIATGLAVRAKAQLQQRVFHDTFGIAPPAGLENLQISRSYAGGPGDSVVFMRFKTDPARIAQWIAALPPAESDDYPLSAFRNGEISWSSTWDNIFSGEAVFAPHGWPSAPPMADPSLYIPATGPGPFNSTQTQILWDKRTSETFVLHSEG